MACCYCVARGRRWPGRSKRKRSIGRTRRCGRANAAAGREARAVRTQRRRGTRSPHTEGRVCWRAGPPSRQAPGIFGYSGCHICQRCALLSATCLARGIRHKPNAAPGTPTCERHALASASAHAHHTTLLAPNVRYRLCLHHQNRLRRTERCRPCAIALLRLQHDAPGGGVSRETSTLCVERFTLSQPRRYPGT